MTTESLIVRPLVDRDVDDYLHHVALVDAGSGLDGEAHSHPYGRSEPRDRDEARGRELTRWATAIDEVGWRRVWGLFDDDAIVGHIYLAGGGLRTELHRVGMGMGIARSHRRRGGGRALLQAAIEWARAQPGIDWIDLGVFGDNPNAQALYASEGFEVIGHTPDRFRVDGESLDDTSMTLDVARANGVTERP